MKAAESGGGCLEAATIPKPCFARFLGEVLRARGCLATPTMRRAANSTNPFQKIYVAGAPGGIVRNST